MSDKKIKTETKSNVWKNVGRIAVALGTIVIAVLTNGKTKPNA